MIIDDRNKKETEEKYNNKKTADFNHNQTETAKWPDRFQMDSRNMCAMSVLACYVVNCRPPKRQPIYYQFLLYNAAINRRAAAAGIAWRCQHGTYLQYNRLWNYNAPTTYIAVAILCNVQAYTHMLMLIVVVVGRSLCPWVAGCFALPQL